MHTRTITAIVNELAELSKQTDKNSRHFKHVMQLMRRNDFVAAYALTKSVAQQGFFKSAYQKKLQELEPLISPLPPKEAENRLVGLLYAVYHSEPEQIQQLLESGSVLVVNEKADRDDPAREIEKGETPLIAALITEDEETIALLLRYWANFDKVDNINAPLNADNETALHIACRLNMDELVVMLLEKGADVNLRRSDGATPLYLACAYRPDETIVGELRDHYLKRARSIATLLLNRNSDLSIGRPCKEEYLRDTPFVAALGNSHIARDILKFGYEPDRYEFAYAKRFNREIYNILKEPMRTRKTEIVRAGSLSVFAPVEQEKQNADLRAFLDRIYVEDPKLREWLAGQLTDIYQHKNSILRPMLDLAIQAALGQLPEKGRVKKPVKVLIVNDENVQPLTPHSDDARGLYKGSNTVYVASGWGDRNMILAALLHELKHYSDMHVYGSSKKPYKEQQKDHFMQIKAMLKEKYQNLDIKPVDASLPKSQYYGRFIEQSIGTVFRGYAEKNQDAEVMVKVPEVIGLLGVDKGYAWLKENEPALLAFYSHRFNRSCEAFLKDVQEAQNAPLPSPRKN